MSDPRDQRRSDRRPLEAPVVLRLATGELRGLSDNLSSAGILLTTEEPVVVEVELTVDGERVVRTGRLIRLEHLDAGTAGVAIEFTD